MADKDTMPAGDVLFWCCAEEGSFPRGGGGVEADIIETNISATAQSWKRYAFRLTLSDSWHC